jgi:uncharacterized protein YggU (UPF0235/DUF167 family)
VSAADTPGADPSLRTLVVEWAMSDVIVRVKPGSKKGPLVETDADGTLTIYVRDRAVGGAANDAVIRLLADHLGVARSRVQLASSRTARVKRFRID